MTRLFIVAYALLAAVPVRAQPLEIAQQGFFYAGGRRTEDGTQTVDQMFVEYQIPARRPAPFPVVMVHGNYQNGSNFLGTPDRRKG